MLFSSRGVRSSGAGTRWPTEMSRGLVHFLTLFILSVGGSIAGEQEGPGRSGLADNLKYPGRAGDPGEGSAHAPRTRVRGDASASASNSGQPN
ncbi:hypothetical protein ON010_g6388 [Phytophthora cinnamomi]|nr:hypothetical protein ON010_g6388 [Phytophthora cinnamomi]